MTPETVTVTRASAEFAVVALQLVKRVVMTDEMGEHNARITREAFDEAIEDFRAAITDLKRALAGEER